MIYNLILFSTKMASLRTAFVQTYQTGHACFSLFTSFSCLLSLTCDDRPQDSAPPLSPKTHTLKSTFEKINHELNINKNRSSWLQSTHANSLV